MLQVHRPVLNHPFNFQLFGLIIGEIGHFSCYATVTKLTVDELHRSQQKKNCRIVVRPMSNTCILITP